MYVPDGWEEGKVSDLVKSLDAGVSVNSEDKRPERGQYSVLKTSCVSAGIFNKNERKVVLDVNEIARLRESVKGNTIIISRMNTPALVGANAYVAESLENTYLPDRLWQIKPRKNSINMLWFGLWLGSKHTRYLLSNLATGTSGTMKNITKPDVLSIRINIPPLPEQQKIAQILSTWDKAIEKLESLIAVKQKRKKALMQQLLTGKKRFAGFEGEWKYVLVGEVCKTERGRVISRTEIEKNVGDYPVYSSQTSNGGEMGRISTYDFDGEYVTWTTDGANAGTVFYRNGKFNCTNVCGTLKNINDELNLKFLAYRLSIETFKYVSHTLANPKLMNGIVSDIKINIPLIDEQQKIASVLSAADKEIETHKNQLSALKQQKKGLMQQLLTGKKRVKIDEPEQIAAVGA